MANSEAFLLLTEMRLKEIGVNYGPLMKIIEIKELLVASQESFRGFNFQVH